MKRYGMILKIKEEFVEKYIQIHENPNPSIIEALNKAHIKNNSVFYLKNLLFMYFEYYGTDFYSDWSVYCTNPDVKQLFLQMKDFFEPYEETFPKTGWTEMKPVFFKE